MVSTEFPSDIFAVQSWLEIHGLDSSHLIMVEADLNDPKETGERIEDLIVKRRDEVAIVITSAVNSYLGHFLDIKQLAQQCHDNGILCFVDLAHSLGCVPLQLHDWKVDAAYFCSYKYLNAGPGSYGGIFIHEDHKDISPGMRGWFGVERSKVMAQSPSFQPSTEALKRFQISAFDPLSIGRMNASLELFMEAGINNVVAKTRDLVTYISSLLATVEGIEIMSNKSLQGGHCAFKVNKDGVTTGQLFNHLFEKGIICDFKERYGVIRFSFSAFYSTFQEAFDAYTVVKEYLQG